MTLLSTTYKIHRWIGAGVGLVLLMWIVTGMFMKGLEGRVEGRHPAVDFARATVAPASLAAVIAKQGGGSLPVKLRQVSLVPLGDRLVWAMTAEGGAHYLIDASTAEEVRIDSALAERMAREEHPFRAIPVKVDRIEHSDGGFPRGSLPAWRITFGDRRHSVTYVSIADGALERDDGRNRWSRSIGNFHSMYIVKAFSGSGPLQSWLFYGAAAISFFVVVTGYYLAVVKWRGGGR